MTRGNNAIDPPTADLLARYLELEAGTDDGSEAMFDADAGSRAAGLSGTDRTPPMGPMPALSLAADEIETLARCDAVMALTPKLATSPDVAWAFDEAARLARRQVATPERPVRWFERAALAWSAAAAATAVACTLALVLAGSRTPATLPAENASVRPSITFAPLIVPADVVSQLAQVEPVVLIANQMPVDGRSLAVLPFSVEQSAETAEAPGTDQTALAIYDRLVQQLATIPGLYVIEPTIAAAYVDAELTPEEIAAYLGVRAVVEGRVRTEGDTVSLGLRFTDAAGDGAAIDTTFAASTTQIAQLESAVTTSLLDALSIQRTPLGDQSL